MLSCGTTILKLSWYCSGMQSVVHCVLCPTDLIGCFWTTIHVPTAETKLHQKANWFFFSMFYPEGNNSCYTEPYVNIFPIFLFSFKRKKWVFHFFFFPCVNHKGSYFLFSCSVTVLSLTIPLCCFQRKFLKVGRFQVVPLGSQLY